MELGLSMTLNFMQYWNFSEAVILAPKVGSVILNAIEINIRFRERNLYIFQSPTVKLKLEIKEEGFTVLLNVHEKLTFKN